MKHTVIPTLVNGEERKHLGQALCLLLHQRITPNEVAL